MENVPLSSSPAASSMDMDKTLYAILSMLSSSPESPKSKSKAGTGFRGVIGGITGDC